MKEESRELELASAFNIYIFCVFYFISFCVLCPCIACVLWSFYLFWEGIKPLWNFVRIYFNRIGYTAMS
jgi:hypothetical protein